MIQNGYGADGRPVVMQMAPTAPQNTVQAAANYAAAAAAAGAAANAGGNFGNGIIYPAAPSFTLSAVNATGGALPYKMQSADNLVELSNGTLGANSFTVDELPNQAGLAIGGAALTGVDGIRGFLVTHAQKVSYVNYQASSSAQLSKPLKVYNAMLDGSLNTVSKTVAKDITNMQYNATLVPITGSWLLTANHALQMSVAAGATVGLTFVLNGNVDYSKIAS